MQEGEELKAILGYIVSSRLAWATGDTDSMSILEKRKEGEKLHFRQNPCFFFSFLLTFLGMFF